MLIIKILCVFKNLKKYQQNALLLLILLAWKYFFEQKDVKITTYRLHTLRYFRHFFHHRCRQLVCTCLRSAFGVHSYNRLGI